MRNLILILVATMFTITATAQAQKVQKDKQTTKQEVVLKVKMDCQSCAEKVRKELAFSKGVKAVDVNLEKGTATVSYDSKRTNPESLIASLDKIGYKASEAKSMNAQKDCPGVKTGGCKGAAAGCAGTKSQEVKKSSGCQHGR
ncbi:MAG: heavy-metal-associated domain-containing protein [Bacteroidales bacterium]|nr:heavy-metal-associated domain-containing protein [Bacteroidales bacterium]